MGERQKILVFAGTRPEAIKLAPVIRELRRRPGELDVKLCSTGQHREMLYQAFADFGFKPDLELGVMESNQTLAGLSSRLFSSVDRLLAVENPDWVFVQGDTSTVMIASLCAYYRRVRIAHVEAGLRSFDRFAPFPEEINRRVVGLVADLHFAPTRGAMENLLREGISTESVLVTGNTGIDALLWMVDLVRRNPRSIPHLLEKAMSDKRRIVLVTAHRRESFGEGLRSICHAIRDLSDQHPSVFFVYPVHLNPNVRDPVYEILKSKENVILSEPLGYRSFVRLLDASFLVLTDSGGIQEEAPSLGKPVLVMREVTERPEGVTAGVSKLVGTEKDSIVREVNVLLTDESAYRHMAQANNPYGDGKAARRIVKAIL